ncbi:hypothetical protein DYQ86_10125 [Acidobacteria bacterium AB60]|nr:hypothetical protein DYQ86_10125 [Acidobacteria bacterium AB60]
MDPQNGWLDVDLEIEAGLWKVKRVRGRQDFGGQAGSDDGQTSCMWVGTAVGPKALTRDEALEVVQKIFHPGLQRRKAITVAEYVETKFVPGYLQSKSASTRMSYRSILKHIIDPEAVDRIFTHPASGEAKRFRFIPGWPYLGELPFHEVRPTAVQTLVAEAIESGYSMHTVSQIRNAVRMIFSFAASEGDFHGENPARRLDWPGLRGRSSLRTGRELPSVLDPNRRIA